MKTAIIGAGLAGCEAANYIARAGYPVTLYEMKPKRFSPAHKSPLFAELVCSNSLKAERTASAAGLLKREMKLLGSLCVAAAEKTRVPAGGALAVDRDRFSGEITDAVKANPNIEIKNEEIGELPEYDYLVIASGPLTDGKLSESIKKLLGSEYLSFYDAAAPIVTADSIDMNTVFSASRYDRGDDDYLNCPFNKEEYENFLAELVSAKTAPLSEFDKPLTVYEGCMPIEVLAKRGADAPRFGPMKPVGLKDPKTGHRPWAAVQLRKENLGGTLYNIVGFQTNLKFGEQKRVFSMIPGLENAEIVRYGVMHRNSFINSPQLLNHDFSLRKNPSIFFGGQISGVEGYMESAASGLICGINICRRINGEEPLSLPDITMLGALSGYISDPSVKKFQPMGANFGILPPLAEKIRDKRERYAALARRSLDWYRKSDINLSELFNDGE